MYDIVQNNANEVKEEAVFQKYKILFIANTNPFNQSNFHLPNHISSVEDACLVYANGKYITTLVQ